MASEPKTIAEKRAAEACFLPAFQGLSLARLRDSVSTLLSTIGRHDVFDTYTRHDITHVDAMLQMLEWLVPETTRKAMSPTDWLLVVLAVYCHDLGMVVTKRELQERERSGFPDFKRRVLLEGAQGLHYHAKVQRLGAEAAERFLYQEYVREMHPSRVSSWIVGEAGSRLGVAEDVASELRDLLNSLTPKFRRDLAMVCESHHLDDLDDLKKYGVGRSYGGSDEETANLQYAAVLLRAADLLHITADRCPSVMYRLLSPDDPLSQEHWAMQNTVIRVNSKCGLDRDGLPDEAAPRDTIEVHAYSTDPDGFFGLTSYLKYAEQELAKCFQWVQLGRTKTPKTYAFPWRHIDDSHVEAAGFLRDEFKFTLDQEKILGLLTGHTLYNDVQSYV